MDICADLGFSKELWQEVLDSFLLIYIKRHAEEPEAPFPLVLPNTDGSLDIDWETESFELLINFSQMLKNKYIYMEKKYVVLKTSLMYE